MQIGLYDLRKNVKEMTQKEVADYLGISIVTYREKEKGRSEFTQDEMFKLSELFGKKMEIFFYLASTEMVTKEKKYKK